MRSPAGQGLVGAERPEWTTNPERSNLHVLRFMAWVALTMGRRPARLLLYPICLYFLAFSPRTYTASKKYLRKVLQRKPGIAAVLSSATGTSKLRTLPSTPRSFLTRSNHAGLNQASAASRFFHK